MKQQVKLEKRNVWQKRFLAIQDSRINIYGQLRHVILVDLIYHREERYEMEICFERQML